MTMKPYDGTITRALRWQENKAPRITSLMNQKQAWYDRYNTQFWQNWEAGVFDLRTANPFGLVVWCIILGLPLSLFNFEPLTNAWAYGVQRGNYMDGMHEAPFDFADGPYIFEDGVETTGFTFDASTGAVNFGAAPGDGVVLRWSGTLNNINGEPSEIDARQFGVGDGVNLAFSIVPDNVDNFNTVGFNFQGGGSESVNLLSDVRYACQLRYVALVSNGRQKWINEMLAYIFNEGQPFDISSGKYIYLTDGTEDGSAIPAMQMEYHVGPNSQLSDQFLNILNNPEYGIMPQCAGVKYTVIKD